MKILEQLEAVEATPLSGDDSFEESKTGEKSLQMRILDPVNDPGWDHVVALHRDAGCFHTSAWAKVLHQTYKHQPFYLQFSRGRRLAALIPLMEVRSPFTGRRGVCLPFSDACEPLIFDPQALGLVRDRLVRISRTSVAGDTLKYAGANPFKAPRVQPRNFTGIHSICAAARRNWPLAMPAQFAGLFARQNVAA